MTQQAWYWYYRQLRIARREAWKATADMLIYGTGFIRVKDGFVNHILPNHVAIHPDETIEVR
jgi:hypothetical protein